MRPTVAEIRLGALVHNYRLLETNVQARAGAGARLIAVIKANAYGHGVELCGRALAGAGAGWLGVTSVTEAMGLLRVLQGPRRPEPKPRVLVMSGFFPGEESTVLEHGLTPQVWDSWHFARLGAVAGRAAGSVGVHLEIDTGMSRQGVAPGDALADLLKAMRDARPAVFVEGILTHFSSPENDRVMREQVEQFGKALGQLWKAGVRPRWVHAGNLVNAWAGVEVGALATLAKQYGAELMVRPGLALYGVESGIPTSVKNPEPAVQAALKMDRAGRLEPVLCWKTRVTSLREVGAGTPVGYGETFRAPAAGARLALLPVGYADGFRRELSGRGVVLVRGCRVPVVGRVSMDQTMVDVTSLPGVEVGNEVVLLGSQGEERISAAEMAGWCGTIPYEVLCGIGERVGRVALH